MITAYRLLAARVDYPLHLGVTEAGTPRDGIVKSAVGIGALLAQGIGDTIRVSLTAPPIEEVKAGNAILGALGLRPKKLDLVACPSCGRAEVDVFALANAVEERMAEIVDALMHEAKLLAEEYRTAGGEPGVPEVVRS
jgi:(E)-4-hydroxy-3-methylbut-2-enyl-diphosphate synthase